MSKCCVHIAWSLVNYRMKHAWQKPKRWPTSLKVKVRQSNSKFYLRLPKELKTQKFAFEVLCLRWWCFPTPNPPTSGRPGQAGLGGRRAQPTGRARPGGRLGQPREGKRVGGEKGNSQCKAGCPAHLAAPYKRYVSSTGTLCWFYCYLNKVE